MKASKILSNSSHRPIPLPQKEWKYYQEWNKAVFLHWRQSPEILKNYIPSEFELDLHHGNAWVSVVAFDMNHIGIRSAPKIPHISDFHEVNIRTYIKFNGKPAVYFLSMEGSKRSSCKILKAISKFPYDYSKINRNDFSYKCENKKNDSSLDIVYRVNRKPIYKDETDRWLTERYAVFQPYKKRVLGYDVHHVEWPMENIELKELKIDYPAFNSLFEGNPEKIHYSPGVQVLTWKKYKFEL